MPIRDDRTTILDVAAFLVEIEQSLSTMQLHKLCFFAYAWSLALHGEPLFDDEFEAWKSGPVSPKLMRAHAGEFLIRHPFTAGDPTRVSEEGQWLVRTMLKTYSGYNGSSLSALSRRGSAWATAFDNEVDGESQVLSAVEIRQEFRLLWEAREVRLPLP